MNRKGRYRAEPQNPLPAPRQRADEIGATGLEEAGCGYSVLDRASRYTKDRRGFGASPVSDDPGYDDDGHFGYLT